MVLNMTALHCAHVINKVSKTLKTKPMKDYENRRKKKSMTASFVLVSEAAMQIISLVGLRGRTFANKQIGSGFANY